jgi:hypothetical protein
MLRRLLLVMSVAALMAAMMAVTAVPAFATIHPLSNAENSNAKPGTQGFVSAELQDPPGLTPAFLPTGGPDQSKAEIAQPVLAVTPEGTQAPDSPPGVLGTNPSKDGASANAFDKGN